VIGRVWPINCTNHVIVRRLALTQSVKRLFRSYALLMVEDAGRMSVLDKPTVVVRAIPSFLQLTQTGAFYIASLFSRWWIRAIE